MYNKSRLEQCFVVTLANRVAVFQASFKSVREEAGAQLYNSDNNCSTPQSSNGYEEEGVVKSKNVMH